MSASWSIFGEGDYEQSKMVIWQLLLRLPQLQT